MFIPECFTHSTWIFIFYATILLSICGGWRDLIENFPWFCWIVSKVYIDKLPFNALLMWLDLFYAVERKSREAWELEDERKEAGREEESEAWTLTPTKFKLDWWPWIGEEDTGSHGWRHTNLIPHVFKFCICLLLLDKWVWNLKFDQEITRALFNRNLELPYWCSSVMLQSKLVCHL